MPHIIVEYTDTLSSSEDIPKLLAKLHKDLASRESIDIHGIKTRAIPVRYTVVGDGHEPDKMIHITLRLLPGRADDLKKQMAAGLVEVAREVTHHDDRISITAEVVDMHAESYVK
ncbi:MAG TPA: 5-carboxymethyl-2-hydroxymuconate Delta-isomerase [Alphaproteobacteria bacterium]|nr:5-carboxymethyl-2-hydroxymuconate Delta-isomerase [Alphaproteobacteria bacterium]USO05023.1 MAG: 5-carboxymethyl-2-hydroxymuconate Delta-isomerase [Rhodospirillales bacterium]HOO82836.1 5-carboxymethyl-2-hydroxymuconate Delta-isomerase [Alphaproteobacteria bacterium]